MEKIGISLIYMLNIFANKKKKKKSTKIFNVVLNMLVDGLLKIHGLIFCTFQRKYRKPKGKLVG